MSPEKPEPKKRRAPRIGRIFLLLLFAAALAAGTLVWMTWQVLRAPDSGGGTTADRVGSHSGVEILTPPQPITAPPANPLAPLRPDNSEAFSASGLEQPPPPKPAARNSSDPQGIPIEPLREIRPLNSEYPIQPANTAPDRAKETPIQPKRADEHTPPTDNLF